VIEQLFICLSSSDIASQILAAKVSVCYAAPGIHSGPANAMAVLAKRDGPELISVCLDFDEQTMRMGFGDIEAVKTLREAGIIVGSAPGLRTGLLTIDDVGYIYTPTALYLESDKRETASPNAMRLSPGQVAMAQARLSPAAKVIAIAQAKTPEEKEKIKVQAVEVSSREVTPEAVEAVEQRLEEAPPVPFDVARQVRVYNSYLQYVELSLTGAAIQRHRITIPKIILNPGKNEGAQARLKTTFDLIKKSSDLSSKPIEDELNTIRNTFTPSLGKDHGRALLKAKKPLFEERISELRKKLEKHQKNIEEKLQDGLDESREEIITYYLPIVTENPPDALAAGVITEKPTKEAATKWLDYELDKVFPSAEELTQKMVLQKTYKDVTFETLNQEDFLTSVKNAFPLADWEKAHDEFKAAGEKENSNSA
jgi:hypothetical protein